jgi:hypothetical protein
LLDKGIHSVPALYLDRFKLLSGFAVPPMCGRSKKSFLITKAAPR